MERLLIRQAAPEDLTELAEMCHSLWPDTSVNGHARDLALVLIGKASGEFPGAVLVAQDPSGRLAGFLHVGLRSHADGCDCSHAVGYVEGWYVKPEFRRRKIGARLIAAAEQWARGQGCIEMASDTWLDNVESQLAHEAWGFEMVDRCVNYRKRL